MGAEQTLRAGEAEAAPADAGGVRDELAAIVAARNEADRIVGTLSALRGAFPEAALWVADDASTDGTAEAAMAAGAQVVSRGRPHGKGANVSAAAEAAMSEASPPALILLCDGDLGVSAAQLGPLVEAVNAGECDLAVAAFSRQRRRRLRRRPRLRPLGGPPPLRRRGRGSDLRPARAARRRTPSHPPLCPRLRDGGGDDG